MARGSSPDERIAVHVETTADVSGYRAVRTENTALGRETRAVAQTLAGSAQQGTAAQRGLASAVRDATTETSKFAVSAEQSRRFWAAAGNDYSRFLELVRKHIAEQKELAAVSAAAAAAEERQAAARSKTTGAFGAEAANATSRLNAQLSQVSPKARTASNAIATLAFAATSGATATQSVAIAAGAAADGLAVLTGSAKLAASAAGIGALITVLASVMLLLERAEDKAQSAGNQIASTLGNLSDRSLEAKAAFLDQRIAEQQQRAAAAAKTNVGLAASAIGGGPLGVAVAMNAAANAREQQLELERLLSQREALLQESLDRQLRARREAADAVEAQEKQDAERSKELLSDLSVSIADQYNARTHTAETAARLKVEREFQALRQEIEQLKINEDTKTELIAAAAKNREERLIAIHLESSRRKLDIDERRIAEQNRQAERSLEIVKRTAQSALHASLTGGESFIQAATKTLLAPLVRRLEALAVDQGVEALVEFAFGNFVRGAAHTAAAAAAVEGARRVASMAGLTSSGGAVGGTGGVGGPSFLDRNPQEQRGDVTVVIQTVNPFSREVLGETTYQLQRAGVLKQPIYAPPTTRAVAA